MRRMIKASVEEKQNIDTLLEQYTQQNFTIDEVVELLNTVEELRGLKIYYSIEPEGNIVISIGNCEYVMLGKAKA